MEPSRPGRPAPLLALLLLGTLALSFAGCQDPSPLIRRHTSAIIGGQAAGPCAWPTAAALLFTDGTLCSGVLVAPQVVISAAHCFDKQSELPAIYLGEDLAHPARTLTATRCDKHPDWELDEGLTPQDITPYDLSYCYLEQPVEDLGLVPILMGCEAEALSEGTPAVMVGFGRSDEEISGLKHAVTTELFRVAPRVISVGTPTAGSAHGDSGGPCFVQNSEGQWRVLGLTSSAFVSGVAGETNLALIHREIPWLETRAGVDLTPCFDSDGTWAPTADCGTFGGAPQLTEGSWSEGCSAQRTGLSSACGAAFGQAPLPDSGAGLVDGSDAPAPEEEGCSLAGQCAQTAAPGALAMGWLLVLVVGWLALRARGRLACLHPGPDCNSSHHQTKN